MTIQCRVHFSLAAAHTQIIKHRYSDATKPGSNYAVDTMNNLQQLLSSYGTSCIGVITVIINQSINQSKHICIATDVTNESEAHAHHYYLADSVV